MLQAFDGITAVMYGLTRDDAALPPLGLCSVVAASTNLTMGSDRLQGCLANLHAEIKSRKDELTADSVVEAVRSSDFLRAASVCPLLNSCPPPNPQHSYHVNQMQ